MNWELIIDKKIKKQIKKFPKKDIQRLFSVIQQLPTDPYAGDIEKMEGENDVWRRRFGSYRIFYEIFVKQKIVDVFEIKRRTSSTY